MIRRQAIKKLLTYLGLSAIIISASTNVFAYVKIKNGDKSAIATYSGGTLNPQQTTNNLARTTYSFKFNDQKSTTCSVKVGGYKGVYYANVSGNNCKLNGSTATCREVCTLTFR